MRKLHFEGTLLYREDYDGEWVMIGGINLGGAIRSEILGEYNDSGEYIATCQHATIDIELVEADDA